MVDTCTVAGPVVLSNGGIAASQTFTVVRRQQSVIGQGGKAIVPDVRTFTTDANAAASVALVPGEYIGATRTSTARATPSLCI